MRVLLDGWQLIYDPLSAAAFHLLEILEALQQDIELILALPAEKPDWLAPEVSVFVLPRSSSAFDHFRWVQVDLPEIARRIRADAIHSLHGSAPLFFPQTLFYSPTELVEQHRKRRLTLWERIDEAFGWGGVSRAISLDRKAVFDTKQSTEADWQRRSEQVGGPVSWIMSQTHPVPDIPYFLYRSLGDWRHLQLLLEVWTKTTAHLGDQATLVIVCSNRREQEQIETHSTAEFLQTLHLFADVTPARLLSLLKSALALVQLEGEPLWGGLARRALAYGVPVVGFELPSLGEAVGPAGYLVPPNDLRALSAAMMTLVVEEEVLSSLQTQARLQARGWERASFRRGMLRLYHQTVVKSKV
ncbi:MAG: hypothetical protein ANABAC_2387 [Anaerolineae bacterium]|nr:MAG: hypothetical protein ANABAC_2387 [Anaerolineae bacterium]